MIGLVLDAKYRKDLSHIEEDGDDDDETENEDEDDDENERGFKKSFANQGVYYSLKDLIHFFSIAH